MTEIQPQPAGPPAAAGTRTTPRLKLWRCLADDALAHIPPELRPASSLKRTVLYFRIAVTSSGFHVGMIYRACHAARQTMGPIGKLLAACGFWWLRHWYGCTISPSAFLHGGLILPHPQGIVIGAGVIVGPRAWIFQNVTIGGAPGKIGLPQIGTDIRLYTGAVIAGPIQLGDNVMVGANAVVTRDVPSRTLVHAPEPLCVPLPDKYRVGEIV
jgi:serine acetyltransferase